jgi:Glutamine synthetase, catalytic domain
MSAPVNLRFDGLPTTSASLVGRLRSSTFRLTTARFATWLIKHFQVPIRGIRPGSSQSRRRHRRRPTPNVSWCRIHPKDSLWRQAAAQIRPQIDDDQAPAGGDNPGQHCNSNQWECDQSHFFSFESEPMYSPNPRAKRVEFRSPDPSCNPYLAFAAMLMAGLDGITSRIDPGSPIDKNLYDLPPAEAKDVRSTPGSLDQALDALERDHAFLLRGDVFTGDVIETWLDYKRKKEVDPIRLRPHPYEFHLYYDI